MSRLVCCLTIAVALVWSRSSFAQAPMPLPRAEPIGPPIVGPAPSTPPPGAQLPAITSPLKAPIDVPNTAYPIAQPDPYAPPSSGQSGNPLTSGDASGFPIFDFKNGIQISSPDKLYSMRVNALVQFDYRGFSHTADEIHNNNGALHDTFAFPRVRLFFRGSASEFLDYAVSTNTGLTPNSQGNVPAPMNLLDAYVDINLFGADNKEYFQLRVGRFKTPYGFQFYNISPQDFITPELSMFQTNFLQNWEEGVMAHGKLFQKRFEYAAGIFNGMPNSFEVPQDDKQGIFLAGITPFLLDEGSYLQHLQIVGSYAVGSQNTPAFPNNLGTAAASNGPPDTPMVSPTFLTFAPTAFNSGYHDLWNVDLIWHYRSLNFYGEFSGGRQTYASSAAPAVKIPVNLQGYSAAVSYFLTGEETTAQRQRIKPISPWNWCAGTVGALEAFGRFSNLQLSDSILTSGLLVAGFNANQVNAVDLGMHWYPNEFVRITLDWQHSNFNNPISLAPGVAGARVTNVMDMLWLRTQVYY